MGDRSGISWTDATWNPVTGCSKVSPGCAHCYAETLALTRLVGKPGYTGLPWTPENATANVVLRPDRLGQPLRWTRPRLIFVNSMSDLFHDLVPSTFVLRVFAVAAFAQRHRFQILTKRPDRMRRFVADLGAMDPGQRDAAFELAAVSLGARSYQPRATTWPLPNVWLGTSVENQTWADRRIPDLAATPASVRFLSCEPLLGPLELRTWIGTDVGWVIVGGESGPGHRPMEAAWVRTIRDACDLAGVPFHLKQWGGARSGGDATLDGREHRDLPAWGAAA